MLGFGLVIAGIIAYIIIAKIFGNFVRDRQVKQYNDLFKNYYSKRESLPQSVRFRIEALLTQFPIFIDQEAYKYAKGTLKALTGANTTTSVNIKSSGSSPIVLNSPINKTKKRLGIFTRVLLITAVPFLLTACSERTVEKIEEIILVFGAGPLVVIDPAIVAGILGIIRLSVAFLISAIKKVATSTGHIFLPVSYYISWYIWRLDSYDPDIRLSAVVALSQIGNTRAIPILFEALEDDFWYVRNAAAKALVKLGVSKEQLAVGYIPALRNFRETNRQQVISAFIEIGQPAVEPLFIKLKEGFAPCEIAKAIIGIGGERAIFIKNLLSEIRRKAERITSYQWFLSEENLRSLLPEAIRAREQGLDFNVVMGPIAELKIIPIPHSSKPEQSSSPMAVTNSTHITLISIGSPAHLTLWNELSCETLKGDLKGFFGDKVEVNIKGLRLPENTASITEEVINAGPDILGISMQLGSLDLVDGFLKSFRNSEFHNIKKPLVVIGNQIPTYFPEELIERYGEIIIVRGEGELALRGLVEYAIGKKQLSEIPSLVFTKEGRIVYTEWITPNLEDLHYPPSSDTIPDIVKRGGNAMVQASRGCPWGSCAFCTRKSFRNGRKWEGFRVERVLEHIKILVDLGITEIEFADDEFTGGRVPERLKRIEKLVDGIEDIRKNKGVNLTFRIFTRPDIIYKEKNEEGNLRIRNLLLRLKDVGLV
ncbi:MAG: HEAT repeat domain-containing protein, partial [Candidatus Omnitrophica bacterium]|nr:HEAT repeat domain-containing protein [Candidatus Omnitrophota bacterium]